MGSTHDHDVVGILYIRNVTNDDDEDVAGGVDRGKTQEDSEG